MITPYDSNNPAQHIPLKMFLTFQRRIKRSAKKTVSDKKIAYSPRSSLLLRMKPTSSKQKQVAALLINTPDTRLMSSFSVRDICLAHGKQVTRMRTVRESPLR